MFTGIVEEVGILKKIVWGAHSAALTIQAKRVLSDAAVGDSIAVNGICLTVTSLETTCESGTGHGGRRTVRRTYCERTCGRNRNDPADPAG